MRTEKDYQAAVDWAEHDMDLTHATGGSVRHGAAAATHGHALLEQVQPMPIETSTAAAATWSEGGCAS